MIHGDCASSGCYAMTDEQIGEIYSLARELFVGGQPSFQIQAYPFRLTPANLARHRTNPHMAFWKMLKIGNDHFEATHLEPKVEVCNRSYVFDAQHSPNSSMHLCSIRTVNAPPLSSTRKSLGLHWRSSTPTRSNTRNWFKTTCQSPQSHSELDGEMNKVFLARFPGSIIPLASAGGWISAAAATATHPLRRQRWFGGEQIVWLSVRSNACDPD